MFRLFGLDIYLFVCLTTLYARELPSKHECAVIYMVFRVLYYYIKALKFLNYYFLLNSFKSFIYFDCSYSMYFYLHALLHGKLISFYCQESLRMCPVYSEVTGKALSTQNEVGN